MTKRKRIRTPARGTPWPATFIKAALEALRKTGNVTEARKLLVSLYEFSERPPARSTLQAWAKREGIAVDVDAAKARDTSAAVQARLARLDDARAELSERLLEKLTRPAADQIAARLEEADKAEELVSAARQAYTDALKMIPMVRDATADLEPGEKKAAMKEAWAVVFQARNEVMFAMDFRIDVRNLVGIVTRALGDHLALEGLGDDQTETGDLIVEHVVPRPDRKAADAKVVEQAELRVIQGGRG